MAVMSWSDDRGRVARVLDWLRGNGFGIGLVLMLALLMPAFLSYWLVASPFTVLYVLRYVVLIGLLYMAFQFVVKDSPWFVRAVMSMVLGQVILNYGFTNIVIGGGGVKFTLAELGVLIGLLVLLPKTFKVLREIPAFWVCMTALIVPPAIHLIPNVRDYGMSAMRDVLSVVDLIYFLAGLSVTIYGLMHGRWLAWRNRFLMMWIVGGAIYGLMSPFSSWLLAVSPGFQSYQQTVPVVGHMLTAPLNAVAAMAAWYALPQTYPTRAWLRIPLVVVVMVGTLVVVAMNQSRNLYGIFLSLPILLAYFGYRKAFAATFMGVILIVVGLATVEALHLKIPGRVNDVTLTSMVDRVLSVSGSHGEAAGAHGVTQRMDWWASALNKWNASPETMVFGLGYGQALTNFSSPGGDYNEGVVVREPHNSFISSLSRGGLIYLLLWGYVVLTPWISAARGGKLKSVSMEESGRYRGAATWSFLIMSMLLMSALSEPIFETPSIAAMYYFVGGMALVEFLVVSGRLKIPLSVSR